MLYLQDGGYLALGAFSVRKSLIECEPSALPNEWLTHPHKTGLFISITSIIRTFVFLNSLLHNNGTKHRAQRHGLRR